MKFEIADWRFEVTWDGLLCQPIERGRAKAAASERANRTVTRSDSQFKLSTNNHTEKEPRNELD